MKQLLIFKQFTDHFTPSLTSKASAKIYQQFTTVEHFKQCVPAVTIVKQHLSVNEVILC